MQKEQFDFDTVPSSADALLAEAIRLDVANRLEDAMQDDAVIAEFLTSGHATVELNVTVDRDLGLGDQRFDVPLADDQPFAAIVGQPAVTAMVASIRRRLMAGDVEPLVFDIVVSPDRPEPVF